MRKGEVGQDILATLIHQIGHPIKAPRKLSVTRSHCSLVPAASGWLNTVRIVAPTICWALLGTKAMAFLSQ